MSNDIAALPAEMVILQTVEPKPKAETLIKLKQQQKMVASTSMSGQGVYDQYHTAILMVEGMDENKACLCVFSETIFLFAADKDGLLAAQKECIKILNKHGVTACQEKGAAQISWFGLFPSKDVKPRSYRLMSPNVAVFATFDRPATGLPRSEWGPGPIARFRTGSNTVYDHQFHISTEPAALGHGLCIAPTGAGKTVLMQFFSAMASRHRHLRQFFFDRLQGTYVYTTAMNGKYLGFNAEKFTRSIGGGMNPFQCEDNDDTRDFLKNWLIGISKCSDHESFEQISQAIELAFDAFGRDERSLRAIFEGAFSRSSNLSHELRKWVDPAQYGKYFNADQDCIDLSDDTWLTTFDMTNLFHDDTLAAATMQYLMFRIQQTMSKNDAPGFIFIDETAPMLQDPKFRAMYLIMLREFRKKHGVVISVFQSPDAIKQSGIAEQIRQAMSAYYLFPAKSATAADYEDLQLTDREMAFVLGHWAPPGGSDRMILIKRPSIGESVVVDVNLAPLGKHFKVFSSDGHNVKLASEMQAKFGDDWLIHYLSL
jgi:type IV secretion system protein VirB4